MINISAAYYYWLIIIQIKNWGNLSIQFILCLAYFLSNKIEQQLLATFVCYGNTVGQLTAIPGNSL